MDPVTACEDLRLRMVAMDKRLDRIEAKLDKALGETLAAAFREWKIGRDALGETKS